MNKFKKINLLTLLFIFCMCTNSICMERNNTYEKQNNINNNSKQNFAVKVTDISLKEEKINVGEIYNASAILTMNVENKCEYDIELSNIDVYPYQGENPIKYFVSTSKDNVTGFIGNVKSGENKEIKIGVTLNNLEEDIRLEMYDIEDTKENKVVQDIKIK